jgi:hypothetical protein
MLLFVGASIPGTRFFSAFRIETMPMRGGIAFD